MDVLLTRNTGVSLVLLLVVPAVVVSCVFLNVSGRVSADMVMGRQPRAHACTYTCMGEQACKGTQTDAPPHADTQAYPYMHWRRPRHRHKHTLAWGGAADA